MIYLTGLITSITVFIYALVSLLLNLGLSKKPKKTANLARVTLLIPARNEQELLPLCLDSLIALDYPSSLLEVYILNDDSSDNTREIALSYTEKYDHFYLYDVQPDKRLTGKMNALSQGIKISSGEIILVTDADCQVPPGWVREIVSYFTDRVGLVAGMTLLSHNSPEERIYDRLQTLDWIFLQGIAAGTAGIGLPVSILGNNFAFRKKAYEEIGGYDALGFSLTEDMVLLKTMIDKTAWRVRYSLWPASAIYSKPLKTIKDFYHQRMRWITGGLKVTIWGIFLMLLSLLSHILILLLFILDIDSVANLRNIAVLLSVDFLLVFRLLKRFQLKRLAIYFPLFEVYYFVYSLLFAFFTFIPSPVKWKGRKYKTSDF